MSGHDGLPLRRRRDICRACDRLRTPAHDVRQEARAVTTYATAALHGPTPVGEAIQHCDEIVARALGDRQAEGLVLCAMSHLEALRGDFGKARAACQGSCATRGRRRQGRRQPPRPWIRQPSSSSRATARPPRRSSAGTTRRSTASARSTSSLRSRRCLRRLYVQGRYEEALAFSETAEELGAPDDVDAQSLWRCARSGEGVRPPGAAWRRAALARAAIEPLRETDALVMQADALDLAEVLELAGRGDESRAARRTLPSCTSEREVLARPRAARRPGRRSAAAQAGVDQVVDHEPGVATLELRAADEAYPDLATPESSSTSWPSQNRRRTLPNALSNVIVI